MVRRDVAPGTAVGTREHCGTEREVAGTVVEVDLDAIDGHGVVHIAIVIEVGGGDTARLRAGGKRLPRVKAYLSVGSLRRPVTWRRKSRWHCGAGHGGASVPVQVWNCLGDRYDKCDRIDLLEVSQAVPETGHLEKCGGCGTLHDAKSLP